MNKYFTRAGWLLFLFILAAQTTHGQSINESKFGKGLQFVAADSSFSMKIGAMFQVQYTGAQDLTPERNWEDQFLLRRTRLRLEGFAYSPRLTYKIQLGLSNRDIGEPLEAQGLASSIVLDAVAQWQMTPHLSLWVGQTKLPGNREFIISSQRLQFVDRSLLNSRFNPDRSTGVQLHHEHQLGGMVLREIASITGGEGRNITVNNAGGYDYTARVELLPFGEFKGDGDYVGGDLEREPTPKLALAASYDFNDNASRARGQLGDFLSAERDLSTLFVDAMFKYRGFSSMAEYANRSAHNGPVVLRDENGRVEETFVTGNAFNIQAGYLLPSNWEVAGRYTTFNPEKVTDIRAQEQYTLGVSKYIVGHSLKVQSDLTLQDQPGRDNTYQFRLQMELSL